MSVGGKKEEYDFVPPDDNMEWWCQWKMNIKDVKIVMKMKGKKVINDSFG